jgi:hypothetical protein
MDASARARTSTTDIHNRLVLFLGVVLLAYVDKADIFVATSSCVLEGPHPHRLK